MKAYQIWHYSRYSKDSNRKSFAHPSRGKFPAGTVGKRGPFYPQWIWFSPREFICLFKYIFYSRYGLEKEKRLLEFNTSIRLWNFIKSKSFLRGSNYSFSLDMELVVSLCDCIIKKILVFDISWSKFGSFYAVFGFSNHFKIKRFALWHYDGLSNN